LFWYLDRYARRRAGDPAALRPFLLVASFVNPHDIVLFPTWVLRSPLKPSPLDPPQVPPAPTADEDLRSKPSAQIAFREAYYSGYGPAGAIQQVYERFGQRQETRYEQKRSTLKEGETANGTFDEKAPDAASILVESASTN
jgi:arylsulfatase A-like enzyme